MGSHVPSDTFSDLRLSAKKYDVRHKVTKLIRRVKKKDTPKTGQKFA